jgi:hypothetical protein
MKGKERKRERERERERIYIQEVVKVVSYGIK